MSQKRNRAIELAAELLELPEDQRIPALDNACEGDPSLREEVEHLVGLGPQLADFLGTLDVPAAVPAANPRSHASPMRFGRYRALRLIGEGGMGSVYEAEQDHPRRHVALKVVKLGMDTRQVIARFEIEREALAMMDHPNIAQVLDAGVTETGRPFFVMELVKGVPITDYCDTHSLGVRERLELFIPVCRAIQHAHQKGIIHRDLKPSNVLVTMSDGKPLPKVIDFGIAKATHQRLTEQTILTEFHQLVGTPEYMSPEQAEMTGIDIDTRSDVYSLGVLLYELLTGTTPFDRRRLRNAAYEEVRRIIREDDPPRPSTRLSELSANGTASGEKPDTHSGKTVARAHGTDAATLLRTVRGELDWIVMKCLEKDRTRRYETATELAAELGRFLKDEPVHACPPSAVYRVGKLLRRNKSALAVAAVVLSCIVLLGGGAGWVLRDRNLREGETRRLATEALDEARRLEEQGNWTEALAATRQAEGVLAGGAGDDSLGQRVRERLADLEMVAALEEVRLQHGTLAGADYDAEAAMEPYYVAFKKYGVDFATTDAATAAEKLRHRPIRLQLATALDDWAHMRQDKPSWELLLAVARLIDPDPWRNMVRNAWAKEDRAALVTLAGRQEVRELPAQTVALLGHFLDKVGEGDTSLAILREAQRRHPADFWTNFWLGHSVSELKPPRTEEALGFFRIAVALRPQSSRARLIVGRTLIDLKRPAEAEAEYRQAIRLQPDNADAHIALIRLLEKDAQHHDRAEAAVREAIQSARAMRSRTSAWRTPWRA